MIRENRENFSPRKFLAIRYNRHTGVTSARGFSTLLVLIPVMGLAMAEVVSAGDCGRTPLK